MGKETTWWREMQTGGMVRANAGRRIEARQDKAREGKVYQRARPDKVRHIRKARQAIDQKREELRSQFET